MDTFISLKNLIFGEPEIFPLPSRTGCCVIAQIFKKYNSSAIVIMKRF